MYYDYQSIYGTKARPLILRYELLKHVQRLSKIEFLKFYDIPTVSKKNEAILFAEQLVGLIHHNIKNAQDLETTTEVSVEERNESFKLTIGVYLDERLSLIITTNQQDRILLPFDEDRFLEFIHLVLVDYFYFSNFKDYQVGAIESSLTKKDGKIIFLYKTEI